MNHSCWNDHPAPILDNSSVGCPFKEPPSVFEDSDSLSSKQIFIRVVVFLVLEHFQLFIIKLVGRVRLRHTPQAHQPLAHETSLCRQRNKNKAKQQDEKWGLETRRQHQLMAEELFPAHASEQVHAIQLGKKFGGRWLKKAHKRMEKRKRSLRTRASQRLLGSSSSSKSMTGSGDGENGPASPKRSPEKKGGLTGAKSVQSPRTPPDDDDDDPGAMLTRQRSSSRKKLVVSFDSPAEDDGALARQSPRSPPSSSSTGDDGGGLARTSSKSSLASPSSSMRGARTQAS